MTLTLAPKVNISQLTNMMKNLLDLLDLDTEDEYGILRPNDYAFKMAMNLIIDTYTMMGDEFPQGSSSTDDQGGIRINWKNSQKDCRVCLFCPSNPEQKSYIYYQKNEDYNTVEDVSSLTLFQWLIWYNQQ